MRVWSPTGPAPSPAHTPTPCLGMDRPSDPDLRPAVRPGGSEALHRAAGPACCQRHLPRGETGVPLPGSLTGAGLFSETALLSVPGGFLATSSSSSERSPANGSSKSWGREGKQWSDCTFVQEKKPCAALGVAKMSLLSSLDAPAHKRAPQHLGWLQPHRAGHGSRGRPWPAAPCDCARLAHGPRFHCPHSLLETSPRHQKGSETSMHS